MLIAHQPAADSAADARRRLRRHGQHDDAHAKRRTAAHADQEGRRRQKPAAEERIEDFLTIDPMEMEIGVGLIRLADPKRGGDSARPHPARAAERARARSASSCRRCASATTCGWTHSEYRIKIADMPVAAGRGRSRASCWRSTPGITTGTGRRHRRRRDPAFGADAPLDRSVAQGRGRDVRLHGGRAGRACIATHLTGGLPPARGRDSHPRRREAPDRRAEEDVARRWSTS